jgi:hypothetical protein
MQSARQCGRRPAQDGRTFEVEAREIVEEVLRVELGNLPRRLARAARALLHLVLAGVGIRGQVTDVGDVHDVTHLKAVPAQYALQHIFEQERAEVADVLIVVDGRTARIEPDRAGRLERLEPAERTRVVVVQGKWGGHRSDLGHEKAAGERTGGLTLCSRSC